MRRFVLGLGMTIVSAAVLVFAVDWSKVIEVLRGANLKYVVLAVGFLIVSTASKTVRWRLLLPDSTVVTVPRLYRILHVSYLLNNVVPARLGDVARVSMTSHLRGLRVGHVVSSLLTERVTDVVTLLVCFAAVSPFLPLPPEYLRWLHFAWWALGCLVVIGIAAAALHRPIARLTTVGGAFQRLPLPRWARDEAESFREGWRQLFARTHVLRIWSWSGLAWVGAFAINYMLMRALDIRAPMTVAVLLTCTTNLAMLVPSSPSYVGVFHAAATVSLLPFDVNASRALSFAILAHLVNVLPVSFLGAAFLLSGRDRMSFNFQALWGRRTDDEIDLDAEPSPEVVSAQ